MHLPWCARKCPYCDFNSHPAHGALPEREYVDALFADLESQLPQVWGRAVSTVFLGGGTPSLFAPASIFRLLSGLRARLRLLPGAEITLEANPGTVDQARFQGYRDAGITRLSIGIQSFDDDSLRALGRIHGRAEALRAAEAARAAGFDNFNLDLMYGLPGQDAAGALADLTQALAFDPPHLSLYQLTLEPNTAFHRNPPSLPDDDRLAAIEAQLYERVAAAGFDRYEVSAFARSGRRCAHNLNYWEFGDYLGIGAGAHGKLTLPDHILRTVRHSQPRVYLKDATGFQETRCLAPGDRSFEFMLNALRLTHGFDIALFESRAQLSWASVAERVQAAQTRGLISVTTTRCEPTPLGRRFLNDLTGMFLPPS